MPSATARSSPRTARTAPKRFSRPALSTAYVVVMPGPYRTTYGVRNYDGGRGDERWQSEGPSPR
ncbi:hypothetical protein SHJG_3167 [Streptomyces hygroscopicus subsp. jinggangensis 5008]|nr:hypothetical protein SHJG_3167 [Streptomyces hygroscopicus subsp. jinggangensis 5008]AGF62597.1 hypothetical protein SHJGH_2931 [Streptomyces hygroscopicus subsp. jinggangensis TL01]